MAIKASEREPRSVEYDERRTVDNGGETKGAGGCTESGRGTRRGAASARGKATRLPSVGID